MNFVRYSLLWDITAYPIWQICISKLHDHPHIKCYALSKLLSMFMFEINKVGQPFHVQIVHLIWRNKWFYVGTFSNNILLTLMMNFRNLNPNGWKIKHTEFSRSLAIHYSTCINFCIIVFFSNYNIGKITLLGFTLYK